MKDVRTVYVALCASPVPSACPSPPAQSGRREKMEVDKVHLIVFIYRLNISLTGYFWRPRMKPYNEMKIGD